MDKIPEVQQQIRENSEDLRNYLVDLANWEKEMKLKDLELTRRRLCNNSEVTSSAEAKEKKSVCVANLGSHDNAVKIDDQKQQALEMKNAGNKHFKEGNYSMAIKCYSLGMKSDPENPVLPANRALAYMKIGELYLAEGDCNTSISLDSTYIKAYLRRGAARMGLKKFDDAKKDFEKVLILEPKNKQALSELIKIEEKRKCEIMSNDHQQKRKAEQELNAPSKQVNLGNRCTTSENSSTGVENVKYLDTCVISPIEKPLHLQSKKPLVSVEVKNVNVALKTLSVHSCDAALLPQSDTLAKKKPITKPKEIVIPKVVPVLPPIPERSYQFIGDWKKLEGYPELQYKYLKQFPAEKFPDIFRNSMETELFGGILKIMSEYFLLNDECEDVFIYLTFLSKVGRFPTLLMLLSDEEASCMKNMLQYIHSSDKYSNEEKANLCGIYKI